MTVKQNVKKEHWTRVRALSHRLATGIADKYDSLKPAADVKRQRQQRLYAQLKNPVSWSGPEPVDDDKQHLYDVIADVTRSPDRNAFLQEDAEATREAAEPVEASLL